MTYPLPPLDSFCRYEKPDTSEGRVALGAAWLDEVAPGWERQLDLSVLDIDHPCHCVCSQLFSSFGRNGYAAVTDQVFGRMEPDHWMTDHGFVDRADTETWLALVKARFDNGVLSDKPIISHISEPGRRGVRPHPRPVRRARPPARHVARCSARLRSGLPPGRATAPTSS